MIFFQKYWIRNVSNSIMVKGNIEKDMMLLVFKNYIFPLINIEKEKNHEKQQ